MYVQTRDEPARIAQALREAVRQVDDAIPVHDMRTLDEQVDRAVSSERLVASLTAVFGLLATLLATIGLYGVMSYTVARRTREIGVRVALGAAAKDISWLVTREVILLVGMGVASAVPVLWGLTRLVESQLYGVTPLDPPTIALAIGLLAGVAALAGLLPARRAARIDPLVALRYE
jgi:ABC-type antimicrobial peptide transport system permease subunit